MQTRVLEVIGGLYEATAEVESARTKDEVLAAFRRASESGQRLTIAGARRSMGEQYLPPDGGAVLDVSELDRGASIVETSPDGSIWVRAGGSTTFQDLRRAFPRHRPHCPPTTDTVSLAGALSACSHNSLGYFPESVRAFSLLAPSGEVFSCSDGGSDFERELYWHVPGSFGALGVVTDIEVKLTPIDPEQRIVLNSVYAGRSDSGAYLNYLEQVVDSPRFREGGGAVIYGNRGHTIIWGHELLPLGAKPPGPQALLTDDNVTQQAVTQALVNRMPRLAEWLVSRAYPEGIARWAPWYGFLFFQRSFDAAHQRMMSGGLDQKLLRLLGVRHRMPFCHAAWFFPRAELRAFMEGYWGILDRYPGLEVTAEQQDLVLLGPSQWPCHTLGRTEEPIGAFTASFGVERGGESEHRVRDFFTEVTHLSREFAPGTRISLCKQIHADPEDLRATHAGFVAAVTRLRSRIDPQGILTSRLLRDLGVA